MIIWVIKNRVDCIQNHTSTNSNGTIFTTAWFCINIRSFTLINVEVERITMFATQGPCFVPEANRLVPDKLLTSVNAVIREHLLIDRDIGTKTAKLFQNSIDRNNERSNFPEFICHTRKITIIVREVNIFLYISV